MVKLSISMDEENWRVVQKCMHDAPWIASNDYDAFLEVYAILNARLQTQKGDQHGRDTGMDCRRNHQE